MQSSVASELDGRAVRQLRATFAGELLVPGDDAYDTRRRVWNRMIDRRPAFIARVASVDDTRRALAFARDHDLPIAVRGGGHTCRAAHRWTGGS